MNTLLPEQQSIFLRASVCNVCNFSCLYCVFDLGMENHTPFGINAPLLSIDEYIRNMKFIAKHGFKNISITGGEPLLNPEIPQILKFCREIFETIELTTNGTKLIDYIKVIKKYVDMLKISIDAIDPCLSVKIARNPEAAKITELIEECCNAGLKSIGLNFVYMKQNELELISLMEFAYILKRKYGTEIGIRILDLYCSGGNKDFWKEQFVPLSEVRKRLLNEGVKISRRIRIGCDSYAYTWNGLFITMKDSITATSRSKICDTCVEYCQEGIYSLKHSASGWLSVCPSNSVNLGTLLSKDIKEDIAHQKIDPFVEILNTIKRIEYNS